mgnify:CR=1 FL=1
MHQPRSRAISTRPLVQAKPSQQPLSCGVLNHQRQDKTNHGRATIQTLRIVIKPKLWFSQIWRHSGFGSGWRVRHDDHRCYKALHVAPLCGTMAAIVNSQIADSSGKRRSLLSPFRSLACPVVLRYLSVACKSRYLPRCGSGNDWANGRIWAYKSP